MSLIVLEQQRFRRHLALEDAARSAYVAQEFEVALEHVREALRLWPDCRRGLILVGDVLCALGQHSGALRAYHRARKLAPERADAVWSVATIHFVAGRWRAALAFLDAAMDRVGSGDELLSEWIAEDRALALIRLGRSGEALAAVRWGLRRRPRSERLRALKSELVAFGGSRSVSGDPHAGRAG